MALIELLLLLFMCRSTGGGIVCAVNRSAIYVLLCIQIHLCDLVRSLHQRVASEAPSSSTQKKGARNRIFKALSTILPLVLLAISYGGTYVWYISIKPEFSGYIY